MQLTKWLWNRPETLKYTAQNHSIELYAILPSTLSFYASQL